MRRIAAVACLVLGLLITARPGSAQLSPVAAWAAHAANEYQVIPNVTYLTASNFDAKLDVYQRRGMTTPQPTVVFFHGGFWAAGSKEAALMSLIPWMEMGWSRGSEPAPDDSRGPARRFCARRAHEDLRDHWRVFGPIRPCGQVMGELRRAWSSDTHVGIPGFRPFRGFAASRQGRGPPVARRVRAVRGDSPRARRHGSSRPAVSLVRHRNA